MLINFVDATNYANHYTKPPPYDSFYYALFQVHSQIPVIHKARYHPYRHTKHCTGRFPKSEIRWHNTYGTSKGYSYKFLTYPRFYPDSPNRASLTVSHLLWPRLPSIDARVIFPNSSPKFHIY